ncbi:uncharacterized protein (DUF58 family) [Constrictibacter sp. MBR-5]|jgi:uncharacterized protein (DUF58 family)|uniref:DUF58 domain-containing protein n=1 Tax=Constrictibacter sp. MBR-5 TaxID=3156467 RepID=UPI003398F99B
MTAPRAGSRLDAERLGAGLPPLLLAALRIAETVSPGVHGRRRSGPGDAFWQFRHYQPGDSVRSIDWRRSARAEPVFVRENEWESAQTLLLWRDVSPSMRWRSARTLPEKAERATVLMLALCSLLLRSGEQVGLLGDAAPPVRGVPGLGRIADIVERGEPSADDAIGMPPPVPVPRHAQVVMFGDFLDPLPEIEARMRTFAAQAARGHLLQVLDPAEEALPMRGRIRFEGLEHEGSLLVRRAERLRPDYLSRLSAQRAGLAVLARQLGWTFATHHTDAPPHLALLALHRALTLAPSV